VLVATNAYADGVLPKLRRRVLPIGSFIIATEVLDPALAAELSPRGRMFYDTKSFVYYWRLSPDGRMAFGGRTSLAPTTVARSRDRLYREMVRIHPQLAGVPLEYSWGGDVAITWGRLPHAGRIDGVAFATGCNGTGVALATWFGMRMAAWMSGEEDAPVFSQLRFPPIPLYPLRGAYLPLVGQWFRLRDRFGR
jgi:glycine/D-amino acid oxidase-like deaminating enzyme